MIPDEAVEAAYEELDENAREYIGRAGIRAALAAAAPHLLAAAWDAGYMCSYDQERGGHGVGAIPVPEYLTDDLAHWNPHRSPDA